MGAMSFPDDIPYGAIGGIDTATRRSEPQIEARETALPPAAPRRQWWRALKAIGRLAVHTEDTTQVFEIIHALAGDGMERTYGRAMALPGGQKLLCDKPSLNALLGDHARLAAMPDGSLGRAYLRFMLDGGITPEGLIGAQEAIRPNDPVHDDPDPDRFYLQRRLVEMHDLWHVLTGYGRDDTGELANLWFSYGQFGQLGMGFIALMGTLDGPRSPRWYGYMRTAYRRGTCAQFLVATPMEQLLTRPIDAARRALDVSLPLEAHPDGILTGNRAAEGIGRGPRVRPI
jgi:ubiquinone biosynthesis protein COQ4